MMIPTAPTTRCLRVLMGISPSSAPAPSSATIARRQVSVLPGKTLAVAPVRLPRAGGARYHSSGPKRDRPSAAKPNNMGFMEPPWLKKPPPAPEPGARKRSLPKRNGRLLSEHEQHMKYRGPKAGLSTAVKSKWEEITKNKAATLKRPGGVELQTWETEGAMTLPHDRQTLYEVAEKLFHWVKWFPGCSDVKVLYTKSISDQSGNSRKIPQTVQVLFGGGSLGSDVRLGVRLQPGTRVQLVYTPRKAEEKERTEEYEISWYFKDQRDSSNTEATAPPPVVGTHVRFHLRVRSYSNVVINCEKIWGRGTDEEAENIISRLGERAAYLQSEGSATDPASGPNALPGLDLEEDNVRMLVRRQPGRYLTMRDRGNKLIRRVEADGADEDERRRLHQRFASRDYSSDT